MYPEYPERESRDLTLLFRDQVEFNASRTVAEAARLDDSGSYAYRRTGPDTATLTTTSADPGRETCSTLLNFTSAITGTYTSWCHQGVSSTGRFQLAVEDPFCVSLWDGLPCASVANLPQVYLGPVAESTATTEVVIANSNFQTALMAFASKTTGRKTQTTEASFADAYRVGDLTAWSAAASGVN